MDVSWTSIVPNHPWDDRIDDHRGDDIMRKLKSIDSIYDEVKDCRFVLTNDAPLATALNKLVDRPSIGPFAMTPRQVAATCSMDVMGSPVWGELKVIMTICEENPELDLRYVHAEVQRIKEIRQYTKDVGKHLHTGSSRDVYRSWKAIPTVENVMDRFNPSTTFYPQIGGKIAVVGIDLFNDLDKCMIPNGYDYLDVEIFEDEGCYIPEIYQIGNDRQLADNAIALIGDRDPNDFAIVMNVTSPIVDSVKTALYRGKIPFIDSLNVRDLNQIRDFIQFVQLSLSYDTLRVKHVREIFSSLDADFKADKEEHLLDKVAMDGRAAELRDAMKDIRKHTFDDVRKVICSPKASTTVKIVINDLKIGDKKVCKRLVERLVYSVENISDLHHNEQIPECEKMGVLLVDSRNSVFIDRPIVIYLGMSDDWDLDLTDRAYVDYVEDETERMAVRLEALLQQGVGRYYLVNTSRGGRPARPSTLFRKLFSPKKEGGELVFDDLLSPGQMTKKGRWPHHVERPSIDLDHPVKDPKPYDRPFSQSGFKAYYECPYSFQFQMTLGSKDADYFEFGNLIHNFAELYFSHPDIVNERFDELVGMASERFSGISSPALGKIDESKIRCGMTNIKRYIDSLDHTGDRELAPIERSNNFFYDALGMTETSSLCERDIDSERHEIHGKMDLNIDSVIDYKTGKILSVKDIRKKLLMEGKREKKDFQALFYLAIANELWSGREMQFLYAMGNDVNYMDDGFDIADNIRKVRIYDEAVDNYDIMDCIFFTFRITNRSKCGKEPERMISAIMSVASEMDPSEWHENPLVIQAVRKEFSYNRSQSKTVSNAIREFVEIWRSGIYLWEDMVVITKEKMESMLSKIDELHSKLSSESRSGLPAEHDKKCSDCDFFKVCTKDRIAIDSEGGDGNE